MTLEDVIKFLDNLKDGESWDKLWKKMYSLDWDGFDKLRKEVKENVRQDFYTQTRDFILKILNDNWVNEDVESSTGEKIAHKQNKDMITYAMLGVFSAISQYEPCSDIIFNRDWIDFANERIEEK